jgi:hypothetical protein
MQSTVIYGIGCMQMKRKFLVVSLLSILLIFYCIFLTFLFYVFISDVSFHSSTDALTEYKCAKLKILPRAIKLHVKCILGVCVCAKRVFCVTRTDLLSRIKFAKYTYQVINYS